MRMTRLIVALGALIVLSAGVISAQTNIGVTATLNTVTLIATTTLQTDYEESDEKKDEMDTKESNAGGSSDRSSGSSSSSDSKSKKSGAVNVVVSTVAPVQPNDAAPRILKEEPRRAGENSNTSTGSAWWRPETRPPTTPASTRVEVPTKVPPPGLKDVGKSLREFSREARSIETAVQSSVSEEIDKAIQKVRITSKAFQSEDREQKLIELREKVNKRQEELSSDVRTAIASSARGSTQLNELGPVLKSSLKDIEVLIEAETNTDVDLSSGERAVTEVVQKRTARFAAARQDLLAREGLELYTDTDRDGISDYDERKVYGTDPLNAYTAGSTLTDGERILLGFDVHSTTTGRVAVESPKAAGEIVEGVFEVYSIDVQPKGDSEGSRESIETITFAGRALPNSFVTLYIFSTPVIVTVKTDSSGAWTYTMDSELEDGTHELHVATVDDSGRILAKSPVIPFVKVAEAAEFTPLIVPTTPEIDPLDVLRNNLFVLIGFALVLFALAALGILGLRKKPDAADIA